MREEIIEKEISHQLEKFEEFFHRHINTSSDTEYIALKAHLLAEYYLNHLLILELGQKELENIENISFFDKVDKLGKLNPPVLERRITNSLLKLNKIRNNLAHSLEYKISEADIDSLGFSFGKEYVFTKFSSEYRTNSKANFIWVLVTLAGELYKPIITEIILERIKREKSSGHASVPTKTDHSSQDSAELEKKDTNAHG